MSLRSKNLSLVSASCNLVWIQISIFCDHNSFQRWVKHLGDSDTTSGTADKDGEKIDGYDAAASGAHVLKAALASMILGACSFIA